MRHIRSEPRGVGGKCCSVCIESGPACVCEQGGDLSPSVTDANHSRESLVVTAQHSPSGLWMEEGSELS